MTRYSMLFLLCFCSILGYAQEDTIEKTAKFFVGFNLVSLTSIDAHTSLVVGGKGGLWEMVENNLDPSLLKGQDGYFTFRFVVNCKGEAGRFTTEESDLKYNKKEFSSELRNHFLEMLLGVPQWESLTINGEPRDAYVYVTFKIKDDEIIEILP